MWSEKGIHFCCAMLTSVLGLSVSFNSGASINVSYVASHAICSEASISSSKFCGGLG